MAVQTATSIGFDYRKILLDETRTGPVSQRDILAQYPGMDVTPLREAAHKLRSEGELIITELLPPKGTIYSRRQEA